MNTPVHGKVLSLPYDAIVIFEQLITFSSKAHFPADVFHEINQGITDALKKNAHDQNEQTIYSVDIMMHTSANKNYKSTGRMAYTIYIFS